MQQVLKALNRGSPSQELISKRASANFDSDSVKIFNRNRQRRLAGQDDYHWENQMGSGEHDVFAAFGVKIHLFKICTKKIFRLFYLNL